MEQNGITVNGHRVLPQLISLLIFSSFLHPPLANEHTSNSFLTIIIATITALRGVTILRGNRLTALHCNSSLAFPTFCHILYLDLLNFFVHHARRLTQIFVPQHVHHQRRHVAICMLAQFAFVQRRVFDCHMHF